MIKSIENLLNKFECGKLSRRQLVLSLATLSAAAQTAPKEKGFQAVSINHVTIKVPDLHRTSAFYQEFFEMPLRQQSAKTHILGVGDAFFGVEQGDSTPRVDHFDFCIAGFNADDVRARLRKLNLKFDAGNSKESFKFHDPDGFLVQVNGPGYVGHVD